MSDYICQELIVEIFLRLPTKSLVRFRSVSKSLRSCIDSPSFIRLHTLRSPQKLLIIHRDPRIIQYHNECFYTLHSEDQLVQPLCSYVGVTSGVCPIREFLIIGSCNGIICMSSPDMVTLWNPSIRRKLTIPRCPYPCVPYFSAMGFGFDPINDDYKIVSLFHKQPTGLQTSFAYTIKTGTWFEIASPTTFLFFVGVVGCLVDGILHWVVRYYKNVTDKFGHLCIMTLDLSSHLFGTIELHDPTWIGVRTLFKLENIKGSLAVVCSDRTDTSIWVRRRDFNNNTFSWHMDFKLKQDPFDGLRRVFQLTTNGNLLFDFLCKEFESYNPQTMVRSTLGDFNYLSRKISLEMCVESLELLDIGTSYENVNAPSSSYSSFSSCGANKIRSKTTLEKISDSCILCSTALVKKLCNFFPNGVRL